MAIQALKQRNQSKRRFLTEAGWADAHSVFLAGDASPRHYERLTISEGTTAVLMDASAVPHQVAPFSKVADRLLEIGLSAPEIFHEDPIHGYALVEDLGNTTFTMALKQGMSEEVLYRLALDTLIHLHRCARTDGLPRLSFETFQEGLITFLEWYAPATLPRQDFLDAWRATWPLVENLPPSLVHKDFHVDNLLYLQERKGLAQCGLLDFQDASQGPGLYDLVSLLEDARRDVTPQLQSELKALYQQAFPANSDAAYAWLGVQRSTRILGTFHRLAKRDGKKNYLVHEERVWGYIKRGLTHPALATLCPLYHAYFPDTR